MSRGNYTQGIYRPINYSKYIRTVSVTTYNRNIDIIDPHRLRSRDHHLDHKVSIYEGFKKNVDPIVMSSIHNLCILPATENMLKRTECSITIDELTKNYNAANTI